MVVGVWWAGRSISETADSLGISKWSKKKKKKKREREGGNSSGWKWFVDARVQRTMARLIWTDRKAIPTRIITAEMAEEHLWRHITLILEVNGQQQQKTTMDTIIQQWRTHTHTQHIYTYIWVWLVYRENIDYSCFISNWFREICDITFAKQLPPTSINQ